MYFWTSVENYFLGYSGNVPLRWPFCIHLSWFIFKYFLHFSSLQKPAKTQPQHSGTTNTTSGAEPAAKRPRFPPGQVRPAPVSQSSPSFLACTGKKKKIHLKTELCMFMCMLEIFLALVSQWIAALLSGGYILFSFFLFFIISFEVWRWLPLCEHHERVSWLATVLCTNERIPKKWLEIFPFFFFAC